jgi:DNA-binding transcriptional MerR regulator
MNIPRVGIVVNARLCDILTTKQQRSIPLKEVFYLNNKHQTTTKKQKPNNTHNYLQTAHKRLYGVSMTKQKHYSIQQLAKESNIPASTVRYYRSEYKEYFPSTRLKGSKYPVYDHECLDVLKTIRDLLNEGKNKHEVVELLDKKYTPIMDAELDEPTKEQHNKQQVSNKEIATTNEQGVSIMQTLKQMSYFNENQLQLTEYYKKQSEQQREIIGELQKTNQQQQKTIKELERELKNASKTGFISKLFGN